MRTRLMDMGIVSAPGPLTILDMLGRDKRPRNATELVDDANADALTGVELMSESESWSFGSGGVGGAELGV